MGKVGDIALFMAKEIAKDKERRFKLAEKEKLRTEKEQIEMVARHRQNDIDKAWQKRNNLWKGIFSGERIIPVNWEQKSSPRLFTEPEAPDTEFLEGPKQCLTLVLS